MTLKYDGILPAKAIHVGRKAVPVDVKGPLEGRIGSETIGEEGEGEVRVLVYDYRAPPSYALADLVCDLGGEG